MNKLDDNSLQEFTSHLIGLPLSHVWKGYGSAVFFEFGALRPPTRQRRDGSPAAPNGEMSLMIEWSWRIEDERSIVCGSWSDEANWDQAFSALLGSRVTRVNLFGRIPEIELELSNGFRILSFMTAEGLPDWTLFDKANGRNRWLSVEEDGVRITEN